MPQRRYTATITLYDSEEGLRYSIAWYRPGVPVGRFQRPHKRKLGRLSTSPSPDPTVWMRRALAELAKQI